LGELPFKSWVKPHRIFTIDEKIIIRKLAKVKSDFLKQIKDKINYFIE